MASTAVSTDRASVLRQFLTACIESDGQAVAPLVTDDVAGWSPTLIITSKRGLVDELQDRGDALHNIRLEVHSVDVVGNRAIAEWRMSADFVNPLHVDDITVEPTGERVHLAGASFLDFKGDQIRSFRHYFDDAALLEQLLGLG